jgi:hypothetical protein
MSKELRLSDLLAHGPIAWPKKPKDWEKLVRDTEIVYEDDHVVAYHDPEDAPHESPRVEGEIRITLLAKRFIPSLMDLTVVDETLNAHMLHAIQQVAYRLDLQEKGFEVRAHVLPPYEHRPGYALKLRAGKPPKAGSPNEQPPSAKVDLS